jgi:hypothetical protein
MLKCGIWMGESILPLPSQARKTPTRNTVPILPRASRRASRRREATIAPAYGIGSESSSLHWDPAAGQAIPFAAPRHAGGNAPPRP